jgi:hypothetical protein
MTDPEVGRRGLMACLAALGGAALARLASPRPAQATHSVGTGGPANSDGQAMHVDLVNAGTQRTFLVGTVAGNPPMVIFNGSGPFSIGQADAIQGITRSNVGFAAGVQGRNSAATGQSIGVFGTTSSTNGTGVFGTSGLLGGAIPADATGVGVFGNGGSAGVWGNTNTGIGVVGFNQTGQNWAGVFTGGSAAALGLFVNGVFVATGTKSQAVPTAQHGIRKLYTVEATHPVFEDFGSASLANGRAEVRLDPVFAATVNTGMRYYVFLTPRSAQTTGLAVVAQDAGGFTVEETQGGRGNFEFDYQVVARVRGQERTRLEAFTPPSLAPDSVRPDSVRPDTVRPEAVRPDPGRATPAQELPTEAPR